MATVAYVVSKVVIDTLRDAPAPTVYNEPAKPDTQQAPDQSNGDSDRKGGKADKGKGKGKEKAKDRRASQQAASREKKHGDPDYQEPASEQAAKKFDKDAERAAAKKSAELATMQNAGENRQASVPISSIHQGRLTGLELIRMVGLGISMGV